MAIAVLSRALDAQWADPNNSPAIGAPLEPTWLRLKNGAVQIQFYNGVNAVIEGPAEVQLLSGSEIFCRSGRVNAEVPPPARGFTIRTPRLRVVDLGTAFGIAVSGDREEVHVFKGAVAAHLNSAAPRNMKEGDAVAASGDSTLQTIPLNKAAFLTTAELERKSNSEQNSALQTWSNAATKLNADPALVVRFDFERNAPPTGHTLRNLAVNGTATSDATVVGCENAEGRWPGKGALEFRNVSDRVRVSIPSEHTSITLMVWVRVDRLENKFNSLFMSDAIEPGAVHWQIRRNGNLHLGIAGPKTSPAKNLNFDSPGIFTAETLGRWTQLAMVYDGDKSQITQYVNGHPVTRFPLPQSVLLRIEHGELGNWNPGANSTDPSPVRHLSARMDEFALFSRALSEKEIAGLFTSGNPSAGPKAK